MIDSPEATLEALRAVELLSRSRPLVLVLEDMHWSDAVSVDLLNQLATRRGAAKLLLLVTLRPSASLATGHPLAVVHRELCMKGLAKEIELAPLSQAAVETYVRGRLAAREVKPALVEEVFTCTEGHPFFLAGVVDGILGGDSVANGGAAGSKRSIPSTIEKLLARQMESLSAEDNALLECAAVLGLQFGVEAAAAMLGKPAASVAASCVRLCHRQRFLRRGDWGVALGEEHHRYAFAHALYRSFLYERIPPSRRKLLHRLAADHLRSHFDPQDPMQTSRLAAHLEQAGEHLRAVVLLQESAQRSLGVRAHGSAAMSLRQALALAGSKPRGRDATERRLALSIALAGALVREGGFVHPELPEALEAVLDSSLALDVGAAQLVARTGLGLVGLFRGDIKMALFECNALHALAAKVPLAFYQGLADVGRGWIELLNGSPRQALVWFDRVLRTDLETMPASPIDSGLPRSPALASLGKALCWTVQGRPAAGRRLARSTVEEVQADGLRIEAASAAVLACCVNLLADELKEARRFAMRAADLAAGEAIRTWKAYAEVLLAVVTAIEKPTPAALDRMDALAEDNRSRGYRLMAPLFSCFTARVALRLGHRSRAEELLARGFGQIEAGGERLWDAELLRTAARLEAEPRKMQARLERAIGSAQEQGTILFEARAVADLAAELRRRGQTRRAIALIESLCASPAWEGGCAELRQLQNLRRALARSVSPT